MDETPEEGSASAWGRPPEITSQLICIPAATTMTSYEMVDPEDVVTEDVFGEKAVTFSERREI